MSTNLSKKSWIKIIPNFLSIDNEQFQELWDLKPEEPSYIKLYGKSIVIPRRQALFGNSNYTFSGATVLPNPMNNQIMIDLLQKINQLEPDFQFNGVFVNWYKDGEDYIGYHSDNERDLNRKAPIYSISLGAKRKFNIKNKDTGVVTSIDMPDGILIIMGGDMQKEFKHSVPKTKKCKDKRINFTVRCFI